ncbi:hypothetical protein R3P38DRAFT_3320119 [Favolaschia claudopus]|uniref:Uncharacterized protein n=1 Tax=Favolaschia claudopus TaxID=2862362 RepID=A0AAW0AYE0_9AGAR
MSLLSLSTAAGPSTASTTTLQALSDYCNSSSESPDSPSAPDSDYSSSSHPSESAAQNSPRSNSIPELPIIIAQSDRFQTAEVQDKMMKALRYSTGSGFTRSLAPPVNRQRDRAASMQAMYDGLPPSPSEDFFFNDTSLQSSTPARVGLGILVPSRSAHNVCLLSPSPNILNCFSSPAGDPRPHPQRPMSSQSAPASPTQPRHALSRYTPNIGLGRPSEPRVLVLDDNISNDNQLRNTSQVLSFSSLSTRIWSLGGYTSYSLLKLRIPLAPLTRRCSDTQEVEAPKGPIARLRAGAVSFVRDRLRSVSAQVYAGHGSSDEVQAKKSSMLRRTFGSLVTVARFLSRR